MYNFIFFLSFILLASGCKTSQPLIESLPPKNPDLVLLDEIIQDLESYQESQDASPALWPDLSSEYREAQEAHLEDLSDRLDKVNSDNLDINDRLNKDMLDLVIKNDLFLSQFESYLFPLNAEGGFLTGIVYNIRSQRIQDDEAYEKYLSKLKAIPAYFEHRMTDMRYGMVEEKVSPKVIVDNCISIIDLYLQSETSFYLNPILASDYQSYEANEIVEKQINPAYQKLRLFLEEEYKPAAPSKVGISNIKGGKSYYEQRVRYYTTLEMSPDEVFEKGKSEVARIRQEMDVIIDKVNFEGSFADFLSFLRTDEQFYVTTADDLLAKAAWIAKQMENEMPKYFGKLPRMPFSVKPVPAAIAPTYTTGRYSSGSYKNNRAGQYWVNTYKLESRPLYVLPSLTLHEAVPGHHHQGMLAQELDLPDFRKTYISAFGEGWGLYSEYLGKEVGMYKTPYEDFGRLTYEMWRACRLVVDVGMHYKDWTREEAIDYMASNTALSLHEVNTEIDRYIGWPAQAVSYKIGELKIRELRAKAEEKLGAKFNIRDFHDKLLENGSLPLSTLEMVIQGYIEDVLVNR